MRDRNPSPTSCAGPGWSMERAPSANEDLRRTRLIGAAAASSPTSWQEKGSPDRPSGLFHISVDFHSSREENPPKPPTDALRFRKYRMYQPPPLRGRSLFDDKKVLLIDPHQPARNARASVLRSHGIGVDATDSFQAARSLWRPKRYDLILLDVRRCLPGEAFEFCEEIKHASPHERVVFLVGPPA